MNEPLGEIPLPSFGSGQVAETLESFCRGRVLAVDMIDSNGTMKTEGDVLASEKGNPCAEGVKDVIDEMLRPGIGLEKENKRCTGVAG